MALAVSTGLVDVVDRGPFGAGAEHGAEMLSGTGKEYSKCSGAWPSSASERSCRIQAIIEATAAIIAEELRMHAGIEDAQNALCYWHKLKAGRIKFSD